MFLLIPYSRNLFPQSEWVCLHSALWWTCIPSRTYSCPVSSDRNQDKVLTQDEHMDVIILKTFCYLLPPGLTRCIQETGQAVTASSASAERPSSSTSSWTPSSHPSREQSRLAGSAFLFLYLLLFLLLLRASPWLVSALRCLESKRLQSPGREQSRSRAFTQTRPRCSFSPQRKTPELRCYWL